VWPRKQKARPAHAERASVLKIEFFAYGSIRVYRRCLQPFAGPGDAPSPVSRSRRGFRRNYWFLYVLLVRVFRKLQIPKPCAGFESRPAHQFISRAFNNLTGLATGVCGIRVVPLIKWTHAHELPAPPAPLSSRDRRPRLASLFLSDFHRRNTTRWRVCSGGVEYGQLGIGSRNGPGNGGRRPGGYPNHGRRRAFLGRRDRPEPQCFLPQDVPSATARPSRWRHDIPDPTGSCER
jgi:hypothetical protein